jgi:myo-inositol-1(or 4)-monophosphatase
VASGHLDAYYETVFPWDAAAAALVAREAGARTGTYRAVASGLPPEVEGENLLVAPPALYDQLAEMLRSVPSAGMTPGMARSNPGCEEFQIQK